MLRSAVDGSDSLLPDAEADVWVYVQDLNDLSPLHVSLIQVKAEDVGVNGEIYYLLVEPSQTFAVHPLTRVSSR